MSGFIVITLIFISQSLLAQAAVDTPARPLYCHSRHTELPQNNPLPVDYPCRPFEGPQIYFGDRRGVCMFYKGSWQRGTIHFNKTKNKYEFAADFPCELGITVWNPRDFSEHISPSRTDVARKNNRVTYAGGIYVSSLTSFSGSTPPPNFDPKIDRPTLCSIKGWGHSQACSVYPNDENYCELKNLNPTLDSPYKGFWWIQYTAKNQADYRVCANGIRAANVQNLATRSGNRSELVTLSRISTSNYLTPALVGWWSGLQKKRNTLVSACFTASSTGKLLRNACKGNTLIWRIAEPDDVDEGKCYAYPSGGVWNAYYVHEEDQPIQACVQVERINRTWFEP